MITARLLVLAALAASAAAMDQADPFWSGWRKAAVFPGVSGVYADGQRVIAWSPSAYRVSDDGGTRWTDDRMPAVQLAAGSAPSPIAQCVFVGKTAWIRLADGRLVDAAGLNGNAILGGFATTRIAVDQHAILYVERGDGQRTVAIRDGVVVAEAPGRLAAVLNDQAVVLADAKTWALSGGGARQLADRRDEAPGNWPLQSGPGAACWRDRQGAGWAIVKNNLKNTGNLLSVDIRCHGHWGWGGRLVALIHGGSGDDIVSGRPMDLLRSGDWREAMPQGVTAVCGIAKDQDWPDTRHRLVVAAPDAVWVWRSR